MKETLKLVLSVAAGVIVATAIMNRVAAVKKITG